MFVCDKTEIRQQSDVPRWHYCMYCQLYTSRVKAADEATNFGLWPTLQVCPSIEVTDNQVVRAGISVT